LCLSLYTLGNVNFFMDDIASNAGDVAAATEIDFSLLSGANATFIADEQGVA